MSKYLIKWVKLLKLAAVISKTVILDELNYSHCESLRYCREQEKFHLFTRRKAVSSHELLCNFSFISARAIGCPPCIVGLTLAHSFTTCASVISLLLINRYWRCAGSNHRLFITAPTGCETQSSPQLPPTLCSTIVYINRARVGIKLHSDALVFGQKC